MSRSPNKALAVVLGVVMAGAWAWPALGSFATLKSASQRVSTGVLQPPTALAASIGKCTPNKSLAVSLSWTPSTSPFATGYAVWRSDGPGQPMQQVGTAGGPSASGFSDTTVAYSTSYTYEVRAMRNNWRSVPSTAASITTPAKNCK